MIKRSRLDAAVEAGILTREQAVRLAQFLAQDAEPRFSFVHVLYYLGGMIAIGAMTLFMTLGWKSLGGWGGVVTAVLYGALALLLTHWFLEQQRQPIPAGIMATLAVAMVPLAIFGAQTALGYWRADTPYRNYHKYIDGRWIMIEFGTLIAGVLLLWRYRFPFMLMPISVTLWYMSMDLGPLLVGTDWGDWDIRKKISLFFGLCMVLVAFWVDLRSRFSRDYAFWLYLFGVLDVLGRSVADELGQRVRQARLRRHQRGDDPARRDPRPAGVRGVRRPRFGGLPRLPFAPGVPGQPAVPVRAVGARPGDHLARRAVAAARSRSFRAAARAPAAELRELIEARATP